MCCSQSALPFNHYDSDTEFIQALSSEWSVSFDLMNANFKDKIFTPFEINEDTFTPLHDHDPDFQFYQGIQNTCLNTCDYYFEDTFNNKCRNIKIDDKAFSLIHSNIRSVPCNLDKLSNYLSNLCISPTIVALTETWLKPENEGCYGIPGYNGLFNSRADRSGGGVSLLIKNGLSCNVRDDLTLMTDTAETLFVEFDKNDIGFDQNVIVGVLYRPPNTNISTFNDTLGEILNKIKVERKSCYLLGDYNINLLNADKHPSTQEFVDLMYSNNMFPVITKPTRVTSHSATLIDNLFCNTILKQETFSGILYTDITDHFPIFYVDHSHVVKETPKYVRKRIYSSDNIMKFKNALQEHNWAQVLECNDAQDAFSLFHQDITSMYEASFPVKNVKISYKNRKPWLTEGLKKSIKIKNRLFRAKKKFETDDITQKYNAYRNKLNKLLRTAEQDHYDHMLRTHRNNLRKLWSIIKDVINKNKTSCSTSRFYINNKCVTDKRAIANGFNKYFVNVGPSLARNIDDVNISPIENMKGRNIQSMFIKPVFEQEVQTIIKRLKNSSAGWDAISPNVVKATENAFITPLTHVINLSFTSGVFPSELKIARVIPLLKAGDPMHMSNYRPVSVLPLFSKIFERLMYNRLIDFVNKHKILYSYQFGFRDGYSTNLAMLYLVDKISNAIDNDEYVLGLYLDFTKAFDTVNHEILIKKLEYYGVRGLALKWFVSYLSQRQQFVDFDGVESEKSHLKCGVPQGSILGPLLFLLYINDLSHVSSLLFGLLFADDSNMFMTGQDPNELVRLTNIEITKIQKWLQINKLTLNIKKTHFMIFRKRRRKFQLREKLMIDKEVIMLVESTKFLGVIIDSCLTWHNHIQYIKGKVARGFGILCKARKYMKQSTLITLYYSFIYPYLNYCVEVWGSTFKCYLDPIAKLQKSALRIITGSSKRTHTKPLFSDLKILTISKVFAFSVQLFMYKYYHKLLPSIFDDFFQINADIHAYNTRQRYTYHVPAIRTSFGQRTIRYLGISSHELYSRQLDYKCSIATYKKSLRNYLLTNDM